MGLLAPGAVLAGYRIESVVGRGGMGVVYRARELELDRVIALKVIAPELVEDEDVRERFLHEARAAASIEHPNVIPVHAAGERDGLAYLAMRFIDGDDARTLVRRRGPLSAGRAADLVAQAGTGLDAIHRAGYVHRDIKPANVLIDGDGHVYVTDFGLAKQILAQVSTHTGSGRWVGTLDYVAPEQIRGGVIDARADVYALGGVLSYLLTGKVPFERDGDEAKLWAQLSDPPPVPSTLRPDLPRGFDAVVGRAMAKAADERFPSAGDLGRAALAAAKGTAPATPERMVARGAAAPGGAPTEVGIAAEAATVTALRVEMLPATTMLAPSRSRRRLIPLGLGAVIAAAAAALAFWPEGDDPRANATRGAVTTPTPTATPATKVVRTIPRVGHRPNGIVVAGGKVWVTSDDRDEVERIDAESGDRLKPMKVGRGAAAMVTDGHSVWIASKDEREVVRINARTGRITDRIDPGGAPVKLALGFGSLWVGVTRGYGNTSLVRYGLRDGEERSRMRLLRGLAGVTTVAGSVWIAERERPQRLMRMDPRTGESKLWTRLPAPVSQVINDGNVLWTTHGADDMVTRVQTRKRNKETTSVGPSPDTAVSAGGKLFVTANTGHEVLVVDPKTTELTGERIEVAHNPFAITADDRSLWVTGTAENTVTQIAYR